MDNEMRFYVQIAKNMHILSQFITRIANKLRFQKNKKGLTFGTPKNSFWVFINQKKI